MPARKIAITIAGAVSLGSYESGVVYEILSALAAHNTWALQQNPPVDTYEIDVITGASAGGMTAAILALNLLLDGDALSKPYDNVLYNAWVRDIDITNLLPLRTTKPRPPLQNQPSSFHVPEPPAKSLLSSDRVIEISLEALLNQHLQTPWPKTPHPAVDPGQKFGLGLAITNLSGIDYGRPTASGHSFSYTDHQDQLTKTFTRADMLPASSADSARWLAFWEPLRAAAVASGAFPIAFRVQDLLRRRSDYNADAFANKFWDDPADRHFAYTDGGVFQNQPLGMAKNLVEDLHPGPRIAENRAFLFISPSAMKSSDLPWTDKPGTSFRKGFGSANANFKNVGLRLVSAVMTQSSFQDWVTAEKLNDKIRLLDRRAEELAALYANGTLKPDQTRPVAEALLGSLFRTTLAEAPDAKASPVVPANHPAQQLSEARTQLRQQYTDLYNQVSGASAPSLGAYASPQVADAWLDAVLILECGAGLHEKEAMYIYDFIADRKMLAGAGLEAFQGFLSVDLRIHDYNYGRTIGRDCLLSYKNNAADPSHFFSILHWSPTDKIPTPDKKLNDASLQQVPEPRRTLLADRLSDAGDSLLKEGGVGAVLRWGARRLLRKLINKWLGL